MSKRSSDRINLKTLQTVCKLICTAEVETRSDSLRNRIRLPTVRGWSEWRHIDEKKRTWFFERGIECLLESWLNRPTNIDTVALWISERISKWYLT